MLERQNLGSDFEVGVVVHVRHPMFSRQDGGQQISDAYRWMAPTACQFVLRVECVLPVTVVGRSVFVADSPFLAPLETALDLALDGIEALCAPSESRGQSVLDTAG